MLLSRAITEIRSHLPHFDDGIRLTFEPKQFRFENELFHYLPVGLFEGRFLANLPVPASIALARSRSLRGMWIP